MEHSIEEFSFCHSRKELLYKNLEYIQDRMLGNDLVIADLLSDEDGQYSEERTLALSEKLADIIDDYQKAYCLSPVVLEFDIFTGNLAKRNTVWRDLIVRNDDYETRITCNLDEVPSTYVDGQRDVVISFFYCALRACSCSALNMPLVKDLRKIGLETNHRIKERFSQSKLIERELRHDMKRRFGLARLQNDLLDLVDTIYEIVFDTSCLELVPLEEKEQFWNTSKGQKICNGEKERLIRDNYSYNPWLKNGFVQENDNGELRWISKELGFDRELINPIYKYYYHDDSLVKEWAKETDNLESLKKHYEVFRKGFFDGLLPQGPHECYLGEVERWYPSGFDQLVDVAIDTVLGDFGLVPAFNDEIFIKTFSHLKETSYQMERRIRS